MLNVGAEAKLIYDVKKMMLAKSVLFALELLPLIAIVIFIMIFSNVSVFEKIICLLGFAIKVIDRIIAVIKYIILGLKISGILEIQETSFNNDSLIKTQEKINDLSIKETRLSVNLDNMLNRLSEEYNMTYEKARNNYELNMDYNEAKEIVNEAKKKIKQLGEVNLGSIEEYERISKRYEFLNTQKEDLVRSEENLLSIINEMDDVMIDKFASTFKKVNVEFSKVFKSLFGGGDAYLELTDPTNYLETGVNIIANPPGKKPKALSLLSGGEMTLTAISLLFAIMNLKDVPFVILDEVESALDEVNVDKFGKYINLLKSKLN